jgi:hypothetical protein
MTGIVTADSCLLLMRDILSAPDIIALAQDRSSRAAHRLTSHLNAGQIGEMAGIALAMAGGNRDGKQAAKAILRAIHLQAATAMAKAALNEGDRLYIQRCGGIRTTVSFSHWDGLWAVSRSGVNDIAASSILRINRRPAPWACLFEEEGKA